MTSAAAPVTATDQPTAGLVGEVLRDIARGGMVGAIAGIFVAGIGGRIVMRLAATIVPASSGAFTENGNRIGDITLSGSLGLIIFGGLIFGVFGGTVWVVASPWIPGSGVRRAFVTMPIAVALTGVLLINGDNPDFRILNHDRLVVAMLLVLVALAGWSIALLDGWLDQRLPPSSTSGHADLLYASLTVAGALLVFPFVILAYLEGHTGPLLAMVGVGVATLAGWTLRLKGRARQPSSLLICGRLALVAAVVLGALDLAQEVAAALGTP